MATVASDRLRSFVDVLIASLDSPADGDELARRVHLSRFHFGRLVTAALGESPAVFRRRLLLERAAYELARGGRTVTEIAFEAGYGSLEAFTRAFGRAFGTSPRDYRERRPSRFALTAPNGIHFHPPGGLLIPGASERRSPMTLPARLVEHDNWRTRRLIELAATLSDDLLDEPVQLAPPTDSFADQAPTIRAMLERLVFTKEVWAAAIEGRSVEERGERSLHGLLSRLEQSGADFTRVVNDIDARAAWGTAFVDATCEPPQTFTFAGAVSHVLTRNAERGRIVEGVLRSRGVETESLDPIAWERREREGDATA